VVFSPDDVGDRHGEVIHYHRKIIGGNAVGPQDHQVVEFLVVKGDGPFDLIVPVGDAGMVGLEAHRGIRSGREVSAPAMAVVFGFLTPGQAAWRRASSSWAGSCSNKPRRSSGAG